MILDTLARPGRYIGLRPAFARAFDPPKDIQFFSDPPRASIAVPPSHFTIFFLMTRTRHSPDAASSRKPS